MGRIKRGRKEGSKEDCHGACPLVARDLKPPGQGARKPSSFCVCAHGALAHEPMSLGVPVLSVYRASSAGSTSCPAVKSPGPRKVPLL